MSNVFEVNPDLSDDQRARIEGELGFGSKKIHAKFIITSRKHPMQSAQLGRPIHEDVVSIIEIPEGVRDYITRPATEEDKARYPRQWAGFLEAVKAPKYPIEHLAGAKPCEIAMFHENGVHTIQDASKMANPQPELVDAVLRAKRWMAITNGEKPRVKLEAA